MTTDIVGMGNNNMTFVGFGSQEGWISTDIETCIGIIKTNNKTMSTHQLLAEL